MHKHLSLLGLLHLAMGALGLLIALIVLLALTIPGLLSGEASTFFVTSTIGIIAAGIVSILSIPSIVAGLGLMARKSWARPLTLIVSMFHLFNLPFGTALAIYGFWVLMKDETVALLASPRH